MNNTKDYKEKFDNLVKNNTKVYNKKTGQVIELNDRETWAQAWADTPRRKWFPKYWFVSKSNGDVISVYGKEPRIISKDDTNRAGRGKYIFGYWDEMKQKRGEKSIEVQNLNGLVNGSYAYDDAAALLDLMGPWAFGRNKGLVNGHHIDRNKLNNDAENIEFVIQGSSHDLLTYQPKKDCSFDDFLKYASKIGAVTSAAAPNRITVITADNEKEIFSSDIPAADSPFMISLKAALGIKEEA